MNKVFKIPVFLFFIFFIFACKNDDSSTDNDFDSFVSYNNDTVELTKAYIEIDDFYVDLVLFSDGIDIDQQVGGVVGTGITVNFNLFSGSQTSLATGTYLLELPNNTQSMDFFYYSNSAVNPGLVFSCLADPVFSEPCLNGTLEVTSGGSDNTTLIFDLTDDLGNHVTGEWTGVITIIN